MASMSQSTHRMMSAWTLVLMDEVCEIFKHILIGLNALSMRPVSQCSTAVTSLDSSADKQTINYKSVTNHNT